MSDAWRPATDARALRERDALYKKLRAFFAERDFLEVDVPLLGRGGSTDPHLHSLRTQCDGDDLYLQTSPEFFMKRLLAAGSGPIFALTKAFRAGERGALHNPEFTLLEWYQPGFNDRQLMSQVAELLHRLLPRKKSVRRFSYREVFMEHLGFDPHTAELAALKQTARARLPVDWDDDNPTTWLEFLFSHWIQPRLPAGITFVYDYPAPQAALAKIMVDETSERVAKRFEVFVDGIEVGNGYWELTDADEQAARFERDNQQRVAMGLPTVHRDDHLLAALRHGLPECAGIALGVDRLLMLRLRRERIDVGICFPFDRI